MENNFTDDVHWLPVESLRGAWETLCYNVARVCTLTAADADLQPDGLAHLHLANVGEHYREIDQCVMNCLAADALYREHTGPDELEVVLRFRSWWRTSVPFLVDPDGTKDNYVYERIPAPSVPIPPPDPRN